jgi:two-component system nitrogen regulation response regulator GlnG
MGQAMQARVAVVDDDAENCEALSELLRAEGFTVLSFLSADAAWSAIRAGLAVPDAVVADVRMPGIDGVTLLAALKREYPETPVVLVSAFPDESVWREALRLGAAGVFPKPIHGHRLAEALRSAIAPRRTPSTL